MDEAGPCSWKEGEDWAEVAFRIEESGKEGEDIAEATSCIEEKDAMHSRFGLIHVQTRPRTALRAVKYAVGCLGHAMTPSC